MQICLTYQAHSRLGKSSKLMEQKFYIKCSFYCSTAVFKQWHHVIINGQKYIIVLLQNSWVKIIKLQQQCNKYTSCRSSLTLCCQPCFSAASSASLSDVSWSTVAFCSASCCCCNSALCLSASTLQCCTNKHTDIITCNTRKCQVCFKTKHPTRLHKNLKPQSI